MYVWKPGTQIRCVPEPQPSGLLPAGLRLSLQDLLLIAGVAALFGFGRGNRRACGVPKGIPCQNGINTHLAEYPLVRVWASDKIATLVALSSNG